jgi:hypothetical protein
MALWAWQVAALSTLSPPATSDIDCSLLACASTGALSDQIRPLFQIWSLANPFQCFLSCRVQWSNLTVLASLDLSANKLSGQLPISWNAMASMQKLNLSSNNFTVGVRDLAMF